MEVTIIPATKIPELKHFRVAAYCRVSSGKDEAEHSLDAQISYYEEYIENQPLWDLVEIFSDEGISGTRDDRPGFQRMLGACRNKEVDVIITKSITRFARNTVVLLSVMQELKELDIDIFFEKENLHSISENGDLMISLLAAYAEEEAISASENQKWRVRRRFEAGNPWSANMLGYRVQNEQFVIVPEEAKVVRQIFADYLSGMGRVAIANKLNEQGIPTRFGHRWRPDKIYHILRNETYTGDLLLQKTYRPNIHAKRRINHGEVPMYRSENCHEPIISHETFNKVQEEIARRKDSIKLHPQPEFNTSFTSLLTCGYCGRHFQRKTGNASTKYAKKIWVCGTRNLYGKEACPNRQIPESILQEVTKEVLELDSLEGVDLRDYVDEIIVKEFQLCFVMGDFKRVHKEWSYPSRSESWTKEMRAAAGKKTKERYQNG